MDRKNRVLAVEIARQHRANLGRLDVTRERLQAAGQLVPDLLALSRPVEQDGQIVPLLAQRFGQRLVILKPAPFLKDLLRRALVLPEIGRGNPRLELGQLALQPGFVKDPSGDRRPARSGHHRNELARRGS
jgi:hypothetical protein